MASLGQSIHMDALFVWFQDLYVLIYCYFEMLKVIEKSITNQIYAMLDAT